MLCVYNDESPVLARKRWKRETQHSTIETSPDALVYNNQPSRHPQMYMCNGDAANEIDEAVDVRPEEYIHWKELNNYYHSFVSMSAGVPMLQHTK